MLLQVDYVWHAWCNISRAIAMESKGFLVAYRKTHRLSVDARFSRVGLPPMLLYEEQAMSGMGFPVKQMQKEPHRQVRLETKTEYALIRVSGLRRKY